MAQKRKFRQPLSVEPDLPQLEMKQSIHQFESAFIRRRIRLCHVFLTIRLLTPTSKGKVS